MIRRTLISLALLAGISTVGIASAADIIVVNSDAGTGRGLDDPTPATPVGGNPGTTRGEQIRNVFQYVANAWGSVLQSNVPIYNPTTFSNSMTCAATSAVLGSSGANTAYAFNAPAPAGATAGIWYHVALADALAGTDLDVASGKAANTPKINSQYNNRLGQTGCLDGSTWYLGLDNNGPPGTIDLLAVVMHEMAHGLGFSGFYNLTTGANNGGRDDIYSSMVMDNSVGASGTKWNAMTNAQRVTAAKNDGKLVTLAPIANSEAPLFLGAPIDLKDSNNVAYPYGTAEFGPAATIANFSGELALPTGLGTAQANSEGCSDASGDLEPLGGVSGKIAVIRRGTCSFQFKTNNALAGGATGVVIVNNAAGVAGMAAVAGTPNPTIATVSIDQTQGNNLITAMGSSTISMSFVVGTGLAGTDTLGRLQLYAPTTLATGSSFSHYDTRLTPNAVMEYAINSDLITAYTMDLTPALLMDEGWKTNRTNQFLLTCDTGVPTSSAGGPIIGANLYSYARISANAAANVAAYRSAVRAHADSLFSMGFLSSGQKASVDACFNDANTQEQYLNWGPGATPPTALSSGGIVTAGGTNKLYTFDAVAGKALTIATAGGTGNVDLYVSFGAVPTSTSSDVSSVHTGNSENITIKTPQTGRYYILLGGTYSGVSLQVRQ
jgi:hypothetical protein